MKQDKLYCCFKGEINAESKEFVRMMKKFCASQHFVFQYYEKKSKFGVNLFRRQQTFSEKIQSGQRLKGRELELQDKMPENLKRLLK